MAFENIVEKGENAGKPAFLPFPTKFSTPLKAIELNRIAGKLNLSHISLLFLLSAFSLDQFNLLPHRYLF